MSSPTIGFGPLKGPERVFGANGVGDVEPQIIDPGTGQPTTAPKPTDLTLLIPGLSLSTDTYVGADGALKASVRATWGIPEQGESDTDPFRIGNYEISHSDQRTPFGANVRSEVRDVIIRGLPVEQDITVRVRAVTNSGIRGPWAGATITTRKDNTPPPVPSKPKVFGTFKGASVAWDGALAGGEPIPADWRYVVAEVSLNPNFPPSETLVAGFLYEAGQTAVQPLGTSPFTVYARLVAVDLSNNRSLPSEVAQGKSLQLLPPDIGDAAVTRRTLADAAVEARSIAQGAVTALGLAPGSVGEVALKDLGITARKIVDGAIEGIKIKAGAIDDTKLVDGAVIASKLAPLAVTSEKLAQAAVTLGKIGTNAVDNLALASGAVAEDNIRTESITDRLLAQFAVKARAVGFEVAGANQLLNSSFEERGDPASPLPDTQIPHWEVEQRLRVRRVTASGFHGTMALRTTFDKTVATSSPLTTL